MSLLLMSASGTYSHLDTLFVQVGYLSSILAGPIALLVMKFNVRTKQGVSYLQ